MNISALVSGSLIRSISTAVDIDSRLRTNSLDATLLAASREMLAIVDPATLAIVHANGCFCTTLGYPRDAVIGRTITDFECSLQEVFFWSEISGGRLDEEYHGEGLYACANGDFLPVEKVVRKIDDGGRSLLALSARDARSTIRAAEELRSTASVLQATFESVADGVIVLDTAGRLLNYNARFIDIVGIALASEITHRQGQLRILRRFCRQTSQPCQTLRQWRALTAVEEDELTHVFAFHDGRSLRFRSRPLMMKGQVEGQVLCVLDISERIAHERELAEARDAAQASAKAKSEFLAMISHEIRTPLTGILGMTELVLDGVLEVSARERLGMVLNSARALLTVINDLLDFSRIEAGRLSIETIPFAVHTTLHDAAKPFELQAQARDNRLAIELDIDPTLWLCGDPARLRQIVINLLGNAIKFTENGQITLRARCPVDVHSAYACLQLQVQDTGIGIAADKRELIFEAFAQSDSSINRRFGGTGLGLAISSQLVEAMGGTISVESVIGQGSTFRVELPLPLATPAALTQVQATAGDVPAFPTATSLKILLAEDTWVNQVLISTLLGKAGHRVTVVNNGQEAVDVARQGDFDLLLMDIQMPLMDGFAATAELRASGLQTPIIALSAHATSGFREECLAKGMNGYFAKPIDRHTFQQMLNAHAERAAPPVAPRTVCPSVSDSDCVSLARFNHAAALHRVDDDEQLLAVLVAGILAQGTEDMHLLHAAVDAQQMETVGKITHRLKGSLAAVGAELAQEAARRLEVAGKNDQRAEIPALFATLTQELTWLVPVLQAYLAKSTGESSSD